MITSTIVSCVRGTVERIDSWHSTRKPWGVLFVGHRLDFDTGYGTFSGYNQERPSPIRALAIVKALRGFTCGSH